MRSQVRVRRRQVKRWTTAVAALSVAAMVSACGAVASDEDSSGSGEDFNAEEHFGGETITIIVGYDPGGGYDIMARAVAEFLPEYLPGNPDVVVTNVPGASGLLGAQTAAREEPDGLTLVTYGRNLLLEELLDIEHEGVEVLEFEQLGIVENVWSDLEFYCARSELADAVVAGEGGPYTFGSQVNDIYTVFVDRLETAPIELVYGYNTSGEMYQAVETGELDGTSFCLTGTVEAQYPHWTTEDVARPIFSVHDYTRYDTDVMDSFFEETGWDAPPLIEDVYELSETELQILEGIRLSMDAGSRFLAAPDGTPEPVVDALVQALEELSADPDFAAFMEERGRTALWTPPSDIIEAQDGILALDEDVRTTMREWIEETLGG